MHSALHSLLYERGDTILSKGFENREMYFLRHGQVDAQAAYDGRVVFPIGEGGGFFGEAAFMGRSPPFTFVAASWCDVLYLSIGKLAQSAEELLGPLMRDTVAEGLHKEVMSKMRFRAWTLRGLCGLMRSNARG